MKRTYLLFALCISLFITVFAAGQENRSTLTGVVTDPTGAVIPNATVEIVNTDTQVTTTVKSTGRGAYTAPFLLPGPYQVSVHMDGFKSYIHSGIELAVEDVVTENIVLQLGSINESVVVTGNTPLVDTANADTGQTLTGEEVQDLPNNGRSTMSYVKFEYGVIPNGTDASANIQPTSTKSAGDFSIGGGQVGSNELLLNGVPNMESSSRQSAFSPQLDAVETVRVDEFSANAAMGDTVGGTVNVVTKSGTNQIHGSLSDYYNGSRPFIAKPYFTAPGARLASSHYNQSGATVGGPVFIPHVFDGRNKLFFFYAYQGFVNNSSGTSISSIPTQDELNGDFHALLAADGPSAQLYDPYSGSNQTIGGKTYWIRNPIPNNCLAGITAYCQTNGYDANTAQMMSPVSKAYAKFFPTNYYNGPSTKADGENNYIVTSPGYNDYTSHQVRIDWNIVKADKLSFEGHRSHYYEHTPGAYSAQSTGSKATLTLEGGQVDNVATFSPTLNLETRLGFFRYYDTTGPINEGTSPSTLGFPSYISSNSGDLAIPIVSFSDGATIQKFGSTTDGYGFIDYLQLFSILTKTAGNHSIKIGTDDRTWKKSSFSPTQTNGSYSFSSSTTGFLSHSPNYATDEIEPAFGSSFALFELGLASGTDTIPNKFQYDNWYFSGFVQDDWKATHNLTLSIGLRLEHETAVVESNNRMLQGWNPNGTNAATGPATAAYANSYAANEAALANYNPSYLPAPGSFSPTGATIYETNGNRSPYHPSPVYVSPRFGFSYAPSRFHGTLAIRGGFAILDTPFGTYQANISPGYTQSTSMVTTNSSVNGGYSPITTWDNPFPTDATKVNYNPLAPLLNATMGASALLGSSLSYFYSAVKVPYSEKVNLDIQKQFGHSWMAQVGVIHVLTVHNTFAPTISDFPKYKYLDHTPNANSPTALAVSNDMAVKVRNPLYGLLPSFSPSPGITVPNTTSLNTSSTIAVSSLISSYPEYSSVVAYYSPGGTVNFNGLMARLYKRMSNGLEFNVNYEYSRQLGSTVQLNTGGPLVHGETTSDYPNHIAFTSIYQLPFGTGRLFLNNAGSWVNRAVGGWEVSGTYQYLCGTLATWKNVNYTGNFHNFNNHPHYTAGPSFNTSAFDRVSADQPGSWNFRTFPEYLLRSDPTNNFDFSVLKNVTVYDRALLQLRVDAFNALNHPQMSNPNVSPTSSSFGYITSQANSNRTLEGGIHLRF